MCRKKDLHQFFVPLLTKGVKILYNEIIKRLRLTASNGKKSDKRCCSRGGHTQPRYVQGRCTRMKIIVVDDELSALHVFLSEVIGERDVEYKFYRDDVDAVCNRVAGGNVDAAFLDIRMPDVNGVELAEKLIDIDPTLKIVFITGLSVSANDLPERVKEHTVGFLYKPYDAATLQKCLSLIRNKKRTLLVKMFDTFDCFVDGKRVHFSSAKSKELFALLIAYNGKMLTMNDAISQLWADGDTEKSKILYRDAVWRLRKTLNDIGVACVEWKRAAISLDKSQIECDYWNYLLTGRGGYRGEFCKTYDWSVSYLAELDSVKERR